MKNSENLRIEKRTNLMAKDIRVLLYYLYTPIENAEQFAADHLAFCKSIGLKGRILVADEGINGTVSGDYETTQKYMDYVHSLPGMENLWFKIDEENEQAFKKMFVRYKKEIVHLGLEDNDFDNDINPLETTGAYLSPKEFKEALLDEDTVVLDTRNDYEYDLGHFRGAIRPEIRNFRELPQWVRDNKEKFMDKRVVVYCTGGVRCEKFSGWMVREGYKDVGQSERTPGRPGPDPHGPPSCLAFPFRGWFAAARCPAPHGRRAGPDRCSRNRGWGWNRPSDRACPPGPVLPSSHRWQPAGAAVPPGGWRTRSAAAGHRSASGWPGCAASSGAPRRWIGGGRGLSGTSCGQFSGHLRYDPSAMAVLPVFPG